MELNIVNKKEILPQEGHGWTSTECLDKGPGKENHDGYVRLNLKLGHNKYRLVMRHRLSWEEENGTVPEGYEIDHICKNRQCFNTEHLRLIGKIEHKILTNMERYRERSDEGKKHIILGVSLKHISDAFGVNYATVCNWKRDLKSALSNPLQNPMLPISHLFN